MAALRNIFSIAILILITLGAAAQNNPVPIIFPMVPGRATPGAGDIQNFIIYGTGFRTGATVNFLKNPINTSCTLTPTQITNRMIKATLPHACITTPGTALVSVSNPTPGGGTSNAVNFQILGTETSVTFAPKTDTSVTMHPLAIATGDFDGDGLADLAIVSEGAELMEGTKTAGTLSIRRSNGDGTFTTKPSHSTGFSPYGIAVADFNNDGKLDIAVVDEGYSQDADGKVDIFYGDGTGGFMPSSPAEFDTDATPFSIIAGDFDCDGDVDLVTANDHSGISLLQNDGTGKFPTFTKIGGLCGGTSCRFPQSALAADFDNNGMPDLAVFTWNQGTGYIATLFGNCSQQNTFTVGTAYSTDPTFTGTGVPKPTLAVSLAVGNFNADTNGNLDLAWVNNGNTGGGVGVLIGDGTGAFSNPTVLCSGNGCSTLPYPNGLALGDFDSDGKLDMAVASGNFPAFNVSGTGSASVLRGAGNSASGVFVNRFDATAGSMATSVVTADFNNDGKLDLAVVNYAANTVSIILQN